MTLKQKLMNEYRVYYRTWIDLELKERHEKLDVGESVAIAHRQDAVTEVLSVISRCLGESNKESLYEIADEEANEAYEELNKRMSQRGK